MSTGGPQREDLISRFMAALSNQSPHKAKRNRIVRSLKYKWLREFGYLSNLEGSA